jgi:hypothetical protein
MGSGVQAMVAGQDTSGRSATLVLTWAGQVYAWEGASPSQYMGSGVQAMVSGQDTRGYTGTLVLTWADQVYAWEGASPSQYMGSAVQAMLPGQDTAGRSATLVLTSAGQVYAWEGASPSQYMGSGVQAMVSGQDTTGRSATLVLTSAGQVYAWEGASPSQYMGSGVQAMAAGPDTAGRSATLVLTSAGQVYAWEGTSPSQYQGQLNGATGTWFVQNLTDGAVRAEITTAFLRHRAVTREDMLAVFSLVGADGLITSNELNDLRTVVSNATILAVPGYVQNLANKVVNNDPADSHYQGGSLPTLTSGNTVSVLQSLVNKWFLGLDRPSTRYDTGQKDGRGNEIWDTPGYAAVTGLDLFGSGVAYSDVQQGRIGDCWVLASLAAVASRNPGTIRNMFIQNNDGTYTVRFFHNGTADYVTVDNYLPAGGNVFDHPVGNLWVALAEKAYVEENEEGWVASNTPGSNGYQAINYITAAYGGTDQVLAAITGLTAGGWSSSVSNLDTSWQNGRMIVLGTGNNPGAVNGTNLVKDHVYAVVSYDASTKVYTVFNPWGYNGVSGKSQDLAPHFAFGGWAGTLPLLSVTNATDPTPVPAASIQKPSGVAVLGNAGDLGTILDAHLTPAQCTANQVAGLIRMENRLEHLDQFFSSVADPSQSHRSLSDIVTSSDWWATDEKTHGTETWSNMPSYVNLNDDLTFISSSTCRRCWRN